MIKFWELIMFVKIDLSKETKWDSKKRYSKNLIVETYKERSKYRSKEEKRKREVNIKFSGSNFCSRNVILKS